MGGQARRPVTLMPVLALCVLMMPSAFAVSEKMGNITFECPDGWKLEGPDCYLPVDVAMTYDDAVETCEKYGSGLVHIRDEVETMAVGKMAHERGMAGWDLYWISNVQKDEESVCEGFWDVGQPKDVEVTKSIYVAATAPLGLWQGRDKASRLPFICRTEACVEGTFRCRDGKKCLSNSWVCDGEYDCDDQSDESNCMSKCTYYKYESSGTLNENNGYAPGSTCTWVIEGTEPGKPLSITLTSVNVETDVDFVEVWTGGPSLMTSKLQERLTGSLTNKKVYGYNNFIIIRRVADLSGSSGPGTGFVATWQPDDELSLMERTVTATDTWTNLTSPHYNSDTWPCSYVRHYTVSTDEGSLITMEVMENDLGEGFEYDRATLSLVGEFGKYPDTYVSRSNKFSFYLVSNGCEGPEKFKARVRKGCSAEFSRANSFVTSPNAPPLPYPPSVTCHYTIRAPLAHQRAFQLRFSISELADGKDSVKVYDGADNNSALLTPTGGYTGDNQAPNTTFTSTGPVVFVQFSSSLVQTDGFFFLSYNLACPAISDTDNMIMSSNDTHYDSEVTLSCDTGYAFLQEEYTNLTDVSIRCGLQGKWNVSRLPSCQIIYCGVPEAIINGFISNSSGSAQYNATVTYQCFDGFTMKGSNKSTCGDGSMWSARPTCEASKCPPVETVTNGSPALVTGDVPGFGTIYNYTCNDGFDLIGSRFTVCDTNGNWTHPAPTCERIKCPLPELDRATLTPTDPVDFEGMLNVTCNTGYVINGTSDPSKQFPCLASGSFNVSRDVCVDKDECAVPTSCSGSNEKCENTMGSYVCVCEDKYRNGTTGCEVIDRCAENTSGCDSRNGTCTASANREDFTCGCDPGYRLFTANGTSGRTIASTEDGMTPGDVYYINHTCVPVQCDVQPVNNAQVLTQKTKVDFGENINYRCNFGYKGAAVRSCVANNADSTRGQYDTSPPSCDLQECEPLKASGLVLNIYPNDTTYPRDMVVLECNSDATDMPYNKTLFCQYDRKTDTFRLQGDNPHCPALDCGDLKPTGGAMFNVHQTGLGATFTFACQDGFVLEGMSTNGDNNVTCQKTGRWGLGNLTCKGERCTDPGTPGGMIQVSASFEVGGEVVYNCSRHGFMPEPRARTCEYNATSMTASWNSSEPACKDMEPPSFTNCPTETVTVKPYQNASSQMLMEPRATDNSGLVEVHVMPDWFSLDVPLPPGQYDLTYTASDRAGNSLDCNFTIEVTDPGVLPNLTCPDNLVLHVDNDTSYTVSLQNHVSTATGVTLSFDPVPTVMVGPDRVGRKPVRVTAMDNFGFHRQCAFVVDIKPNACLDSYIESGLRNASKVCTGAGDGNRTCTVTCNSGFAFQSGARSMTYSCHGANEWAPSLPVEACVDTVVPEYTYEVTVTFKDFGIDECEDGIRTKLIEHVPTQRILCFYKLSNGTDTQMTFKVEQVEFFDKQRGSISAKVSLILDVDPTPVKNTDHEACAARMKNSANIVDMFSLTLVTCPKEAGPNFTAFEPELVNSGKSCTVGRTLTTVDNQDMCVQCAPGNVYQASGANCVECPDGQFQSAAGQTQCNACSDGGRHSASPRSSADQCVAPCPLGFSNGVGQTQDTDVQCVACPVDHYLDTPFSANCTKCPDGKTTSGVEGATSLTACIDKCGAGMYPVNNTHCDSCPRGYYKSSTERVKCDPCDSGQTTANVGSTSAGDCVAVTEAVCKNGGSATTKYHKSYCVCPSGYTGEECETKVNACHSSPCYNGGTCMSTGPNTYLCECPSEKTCVMEPVDLAYITSRHEEISVEFNSNVETCNEKCINTTECAAVMLYNKTNNEKVCYLYNATQYTLGNRTERWTTFLKSCAKTFLFEGSRCEKDLTDDCTNDTCADRRFCRDMVGRADCVCPSDSKFKQPRCETDEKVCEPNPCENGAKCLDSGNGVRATCICLPGFTGAKCEKNIDECAMNPDGCLFGGICVDGVDSYSCDCGNYSGDHCQNETDFCAAGVCKPGLCYNDYNISSHVCVCEFPYTLGPDGGCKAINMCEEDNPCLNNSTCSPESPGVASCQCMDGYTGSRCQHNIDDCASMPCTNGVCNDLVNDYECVCNPGFEKNGVNCENINDCASSSCMTSPNMKGCEDLVEDYRCVCKTGFTGKNCEIDIDECLSLPCQHNGTCSQSSTPGQYNCTCVDGWMGPNCENLDEFCTPEPCQSGGKCYSLQDQYFCKCLGGSSGKNCEESKNVCTIIDPCMSPSTCQGGNGSTICQCPQNYTGSSCNLIEDSCSKDNPCQNGGSCMLNMLGHTCQCSAGFSGVDCTKTSDICDSVTCPSGSTCVEAMKEAVCLCGATQLKSGNVCKDASNDFDIYFARSDKAVRAIQPIKLTKDVLSVMFWLAPMDPSPDTIPMQLTLGNGTNVLSVSLENVTFGDGDGVRFQKASFKDSTWNQFSATWNATSYELYLNGIRLGAENHSITFPPQNELIYVYIGKHLRGHISQLTVWQRGLGFGEVGFDEVLAMYGAPKTPSTEDLVLGWSGYRLKDNLWARAITPSVVKSLEQVCEPGRTNCSAEKTSKDMLAVQTCPQNNITYANRLVQVNDLFPGGANMMSNIDGTLVTFGAYRLVFLKKDSQGNVGFCRFTTYVRRNGTGGKRQSCDATDGLDTKILRSCGSENKGRIVQCSQGVAPLSPKVLTCGKLGSYNRHNPDRWPAAVVCGAVTSFKYKVTLTLRYKLGVTCSSPQEEGVGMELKRKVKELQSTWIGLCTDSSCANVDTSDIKCEGSNTRSVDPKVVVAKIVLNNVPANLTNGVLTLTAKELLETKTKESDSFEIPDIYSAELLKNEAMVDAEPSCEAGQGLHDGVCVDCTSGSFLNESLGMCQLCPIGSYTTIDKEKRCKSCDPGQTTLQLGATECFSECRAGQFYNVDASACEPCPKNFYSNETGQVSCKPCPAGTATEREGANMLGLCFDTCAAGTELNGSVCVPCPRGMYSDGVKFENCVDCPDGKTTAGTSSTSVNSCDQTACDPGNYRNSTSNTCMQCDYGSFQPEKWQDECTPCNTSYTTENMGATSADQCMFVCDPGKENLSGTDCTPCQIGFYRDNSLAQRFMNCSACNDTFTTAQEGSVSADDCKIRICNAGSYRNETDNQCYPCPVGEYQDESLQTSCKPCPRNLTTKQEGSDNVTKCVFYCAPGYEVLSAENETCKACERGNYKTNVGSTKFDMCTPCAINTTNDVASDSEDDCDIPKCVAGQTISATGVCENCAKDTYQDVALPQRSTECIPCPAGTGTMDSKQTSSSDCKSICEAGKQYNQTTMTCEACPLGTYNTGNDTQRFEQCAPCPDGYVTVNEMTGATSVDNCTLRDCPAGQKINGSDCVPCPVGTYQEMPRQVSCTPCGPKTNTSGEGSTQANDCTISCPAGEEQVISGQETCTACQPDTVKEIGGPGKCTPCEKIDGNFTANDARTACDVLYCDKGFQYNSAGPSCDPCEIGKYKDERGNTTECQQCPTNSTTAGVASTSKADCSKANCDKGFYSPNDMLPCLACPVGTYKAGTGNMNCTSCPAENTTAGIASTDAEQCSLVVCPVGQYRNDMNQCVNCSEGSYQNETGQTKCITCPMGYTTVGTGADSHDDCKIVCSAGSYRNDTTNMCEECPVGKYQEQEGQTGCTDCQQNYTTNSTGSVSSTDCYVICQAGKFAASRDRCEPCPHGQYQSAESANECKACNNGSTTLQMGATSEEQCQPICDRGQYLNTTSRMCVACPLGTYNGVAGTDTTAVTQCTNCKEGLTTSTIASESEDACNTTDCLPGSFRSSFGGCQECPVGTYQPMKSQMSCIPCGPNNTTLLPGRIYAKYCVPDCPSGQEYVQSNQTCQPCRVGFYRKASTNVTDCIKCAENFTTVLPGEDSCVPKATTEQEPPRVRITLRVKIRLVIKPCSGGTFNKDAVVDAVWEFVRTVIENIDIRFPAICKAVGNSPCGNLKITFGTGCLAGYMRPKRATSPEEQIVEVKLEDVESEVRNIATGEFHDSAIVLERAFYDRQVAAAVAEKYGVEFLRVDPVRRVFQPVPGYGPLMSDGSPAGSVDAVSPTNPEISYGPCPNGTYSSSGAECVPCEKDTYQDQTGQTSCKNCPPKTYTASTGAKSQSMCGKKCDEADAKTKYCSGRGTCTFDLSASDGVRCVCDDGFDGSSCAARQAKASTKTTMVAGIAGGAGAFLVLVLIVVGIVACLRRKAKKGEKDSSESTENKQIYGQANGYPESGFQDYAHPMFANPAARALPGQPSLVYMNPEAYDQEYRDFYHSDRASAAPSRQRSRSYTEAWSDLPSVL